MGGRVKHQRARYFCANVPGRPGCGRTYIVAAELDELIVEAVLYRLDTPELRKRLAGQTSLTPDETDAQRDVEDCTAQLEELAAAYGQRNISYAEWMAARKPIQVRLDSARQQLHSDTRLRTLQDFATRGDNSLRTRWSQLNLAPATRHHLHRSGLRHCESTTGPGSPPIRP
jgi:hypothetical protein